MRIDESILKDFVARLIRYRKLTKHGFVPEDWPDDPTLARWSAHWRKNWAKLSTTQKPVLKGAGFVYRKPDVYWFCRYYEMKHFLMTNTVTDVKRDKNKKLYNWYYTVKVDFDNGNLEPFKKNLLKQIGLDFHPRRLKPDDAWRVQFNKLAAFKKKHGHCRVPSNSSQLRSLYDWTCMQRRKDGQNLLTTERKKMLNTIGFVWRKEIQEKRNDRWESMFQQLVAYKQQSGTTIVSSIDARYHQLRVWTDKQRKYFDQMSAPRKKKLLSIGFRSKRELASEKDSKWETMFRQLKTFYRKYKHSRVPVRSKEFPKLGTWVLTQRKHKDKLSKDKRKKLMQLRFVWDIQEHIKQSINRHWDEKFSLMEEFYRQHGHVKITDRHRIRGMVRWMITQRKNKYKLSPEQVGKLNSVKFEWSISTEKYREELFANHYNDLLKYYQKHGNCNVPILYAENPSLGRWVHNIKKNKIKLTANMRGRLRKLGL